MKLSKAQLKALEAVESAEIETAREMYLAYRGMRTSTREKLISLGLVKMIRLGLLMIGLELTPAGRKALEEARNGK